MRKIILALAVVSIFTTTFAQTGYKVNDVAMKFNLKNVNGNMVSFDNFPSAKGIIVIFTCNHCPFSQAYEDRIIALNNKYLPLGYPVIAINPNDPERVPEDSYAAMQVRAAEKGFTFPYLIDETQQVALTYGAVRTPHVFLLKKESGANFKVKYIGAIDDSAMNPNDVGIKYLENAADALLNNQEANPTTTVAIGCTIKWKK